MNTTDPLTVIADAMREHWLCTIRDEADADGNLPCRCGDWREPGAEADDENDWDHHLAEAALRALQGLYVPPPPGSDRDALPDAVLAVIELPPYLSTGCQAAQAIETATRAGVSLDGWADREHASCRKTRKQDMVPCTCHCHRAGSQP